MSFCHEKSAVIGNGRHIRTIPVPNWVKETVDAWLTAAGIDSGPLFRCVCRACKPWGDRISEKTVWHVVKKAAASMNIPHLAPHDLRRSCARLCHDSGASVITLLTAAKASPSRSLFPALVVSINTGLRNEELRLLKWQQVDLQTPEIRVGKSKTKGGTGRHVKLNSWAVEVLNEWRSWFPHWKPEHFVFPSESYSLVGKAGQYGGDVQLGRVHPNKPVSTWKTSWTTVRRKAGVECRWHDLRHTCASALGAAGAMDQTMKSILGWMSEKMIERYSHTTNEAKQAAVDALPRPQLVQ